MSNLKLRKHASNFALAIALASGTAMVAGHIAPDPAQAQRSSKKKKKGEESEQQAQYSEEFVAAYQPLNEQLNEEGVNVAALRSQIDALAALSSTPDEMVATGGLIYNAGLATKDQSLQYMGVKMMLESGKASAANVGQLNMIAYQISRNEGDNAEALEYLQAAIDSGYSDANMTTNDLRLELARNYIAMEDYDTGLQVLDNVIAAQESAGGAADESVYNTAFSVAYNNQLTPAVYDYANAKVLAYPNETSWLNAINIVRQLNQLSPEATLDALRLSRIVDAMTTKEEYLIYLETADARSLPQEVKSVIEQGYAEGTITPEDTFIAEQLNIAESGIEQDRAELASLEQDAMAAGASIRTVTAAGNVFLSYGEYEKAARFYEKALGMPGAKTNELLTRLGISQVQMGDYDAGKQTLAKVTGERERVASLWSLYADTQASGSANAPAAPATMGR